MTENKIILKDLICDSCNEKDPENIYFKVDFEDGTTNTYCPACMGIITDIPEQIISAIRIKEVE